MTAGMLADNFDESESILINLLCGHASCISYIDGLLVVHCENSDVFGAGPCDTSVAFRLTRLQTIYLNDLAMTYSDEPCLRFYCKTCNDHDTENRYRAEVKLEGGKIIATCPICGGAITKGTLAKAEEIN